MIILGVDPGLAVMGVGVLVVDGIGAQPQRLHHGVVRTRQDAPLAERLLMLHDGVGTVAREWGVTDAAVESPFVGENARSALALGHARAAALVALAALGLPVAEYAPALVKQTVAGYGRGDKEQVARMVQLQLGLKVPPTPADAADALAVALTHWAHLRMSAQLAPRLARAVDPAPAG